ncbi:hypothetical protein ACQ4PT_025278 [Festuca glaucescens]
MRPPWWGGRRGRGPVHNCRTRYEAKVCFDQKVTGAILCKAPAGTPIRAFHLDAFNPPRGLLDQWIIIVVSSGVVEEIDIKLRYWEFSGRRLCPFGSSHNASADFDKCDRKRYVKTQHHLFGCPALRRLRLTNWTLDLPPPLGAVMSSLDTLCLTRIMDPKDQLQQLLANCPRLTDLTLQECPSLKRITVTSAHLRSFAMICCHNARRVKLTSSRLQSLHYQGGLPRKSLFKLANHAGVAALKIEICEGLSEKEPAEFVPATKLIRRCTELAYLHLSLYPSMAHCSSIAVPSLQHLRQLGLQCCLWDDQDIPSVALLLRDTRNLEVLSLFLQGPESESDTEHEEDDDDGVDYTEPEDDGGDGDYTEPGDSADDGVDYTEPGDNAGDGVDYTAPEDHGNDCADYTDPDCHADDGVDYSQLTDSFWQMHIRCLDDKLRRINIREYEGLQLEKILVKFLLLKAVALEEVSVTLMVGRSQNKREIAKELRSWRLNPHTRVTINA